METSERDPCVSKTVSLHQSMYAQIDREAVRRGLTRSMLIRRAIRLYFLRRHDDGGTDEHGRNQEAE